MAHSKSEIDRYVDGALPAEREAALRAHLRDCDDCRGYYDSLRKVERALAGDPDRPAPSENARIVGRLVGRRAGQANWEDRLLWIRPSAALGAAAAIALLAIGGVFLLSSGKPPAGRLAAGTVTVNDVVVPIGHTLSGEFQVAADGSRASVELSRGGTIHAEPATVARLSPDGSGIELLAGKIRCEVTPSDRTFSVKTPTGVVEVLGTTFVVAHAAETGTGVWVVSGSVAVQAPDGSGRVLLRSGERTRIETGRHPEPQVTYEPAELLGTGRLDLAVAPWADVFIDGVRVETTPLTTPLSLVAGPHRLELRNPGMTTHEETIVIEAGKTLTLRVRLQPLP